MRQLLVCAQTGRNMGNRVQTPVCRVAIIRVREHSTTCRTTVVVRFCFIVEELFPNKLTDHEQIHFLYISLHVLIRMIAICVCSRWHFRGISCHFAFEAVAVYSPTPVLML